MTPRTAFFIAAYVVAILLFIVALWRSGSDANTQSMIDCVARCGR